MVKILVEAGAPVHGYQWQSENGYKNVPIISYLLSKGAVINPQKEDLLTEFSRIGDLDMVKYILEKGADPRAMDFSAFTAAVSSGNIEVLKALHMELKQDKYGNALRHIDAENLLITAVRSGKLEMLKHILSITVRKEPQWEVVKEAVRRRNIEMVEYLLTVISSPDKWLMSDAISSRSAEMVKLLIEKGIYNEDHVRDIVKRGNLEVIQALPVRSIGSNSFIDACELGFVEVVDYLLTTKPEFKEYINRGLTAAVERDRIDVMKYLVSKGVNAHTKSNEMIEEAARKGRYNVVAYLLTLYDEVYPLDKLDLRKPIPERPWLIPI